jgi:hypothetical protein
MKISAPVAQTNIARPRFGDLEIGMYGDKPENVLIQLHTSDRVSFDDDVLSINMIPVGRSPEIGQLVADLRVGQAPDADTFRWKLAQLIGDDSQLQLTKAEGFRYAHLNDTKWGALSDKTPLAFMQQSRQALLKAIETHVFRKFGVDNAAPGILNDKSLWLVPRDLEKADDLFLNMAKYGCVRRKQG